MPRDQDTVKNCLRPASPARPGSPASTSSRASGWRRMSFGLAAALAAWGPAAIAVAASAQAHRLEPAEIDRAVAAFTGAAIGEVGGARAPADQRLQLAACDGPLITSWYGTRKSAVRVECSETRSGAAPWRIFVATRPAAPNAPGPARTTPQPRAGPAIKRGDPVTIVVRGRGFTVQQPGEAMENGQVGDWIAVRTARQADPVRARIVRPGLAVIPVG